jgi:hypothetical protein
MMRAMVGLGWVGCGFPNGTVKLGLTAASLCFNTSSSLLFIVVLLVFRLVVPSGEGTLRSE